MLDPQITLFGRKIQVKGDEDYHSPSSINDSCDDQVDKELVEASSMEENQEDDNSSAETINSEKDSESKDTKNPDQKQLKKPDKLLPCPRCKSMDTKFCYYNNYNINQPRHFCKSCYRYWTAGGTMRNVPVGAGRRKNKSSASRLSHLIVSEALESARFDGLHHPGLSPNGTVLTFGPDNPFCEPMGSVVDMGQKKVLNNRDNDRSMADDRSNKGAHEAKQYKDWFDRFQWPYMWNHPGVNVPVPTPFASAVFPVPIFQHPYWNHPSAPIPFNLPTLGKHTRDGQMVTPNENSTNTTSTVLMPKTLRIDNPDEAAKSSIWSTLGIKKDKSESLSKGFFNNFQSKVVDGKDRDLEATPAFIKANPVAMCRSIGFQERA